MGLERRPISEAFATQTQEPDFYPLYDVRRCGLHILIPAQGRWREVDPWGMQASHFNYFANTKPVKEPVKTKYNQTTLPIPTQTRDCPGGSSDGGACGQA